MFDLEYVTFVPWLTLMDPRGAFAIAVVAVALGCAGGARYVAPQLPAEQLSLVTSDDRATILSVDGLEPGISNEPSSKKTFYVATGCRVLLVQYDATYVQAGKNDGVPFASIALAEELATREEHHYSTFKPIRFVLPAKPGAQYWVTASFNGAEFLPRIAELDAEGQAIAHLQPDGKCP